MDGTTWACELMMDERTLLASLVCLCPHEGDGATVRELRDDLVCATGQDHDLVMLLDTLHTLSRFNLAEHEQGKNWIWRPTVLGRSLTLRKPGGWEQETWD